MVADSPYFAAPAAIRTGVPIVFSGLLLPADATGTITFLVDGVAGQTSTVTPQTVGRYVAIGESSTFAGYIADPAQRYQSIVGAALNLNVTTYATPGSSVCDNMLDDVVPNGVGVTTIGSPLYSLFTGNTEASGYGVGPNEAVFNLCDQAAISWLGLARAGKILIGDPGVAIRSGAWTNAGAFGNCCYNALTSTTGSGAVRFTMTTYGGAAYLWYLLQASAAGSFAVSVDGGLPGAATSTLFPAASADNIAGSYALLRIPVAAGAHTFDVTAQSGTVSVFAMGTPPAGGVIVPTVLVADVQNTQYPSLAAGVAEYTLDTEANIALLHADGLDVRFVPTQSYMFATPAEMVDARQPNALGLSELAQAFLSVITPAAPATGSQNVATASYTTSSLVAGSHEISASYSGDLKYASAASNTSVTVYDPTSAVSLGAGGTIFPPQTPITLSAVVTVANAMGAINFYDVTGSAPVLLGSGWIGGSIAEGVAIILPSLSAGSHSLIAQYAGDIYNTPSVSPTIGVIISASYTTTALTSPATRYYGGATVSVTAAVSPMTATGTVTFLDGAAVLAQLPVSAGVANYSTAALTVGVHNLTASYGGNGTEDASQSPVLSVEVDQNPTTVALAQPPATSPYGTALTLIATVSPATATGAVTLMDGATALGQSAIVNGIATLSTSTLAVGTHTLTAVYSGDGFDLPAVSSAVMTQITLDNSATTLAPIPATIAFGAALALTASVTPAGAMGTITFTDSVFGSLGQASLANGVASVTASSLTRGVHSLSASYSGDSLRASSTSPMLLTTVTAIASVTLAAPPAVIPPGDPLTLVASITPASASGTVVFRDATFGTLGQATVTNGTATLTLPSPAPGAYAITATYSGDTLDSAATSAVVTTLVGQTPTSASLTSSASSAVITTPVALTATLSVTSATGSFLFYDGTTAIGSALVSAGKASFSTSALAIGAHSLHAVYSGDTLDAACTSASVSVTITAAITTTALGLAQSSVVAGSPITVNVRVSGAPVTPTGSTTVRSGATTLGSGTLANGTSGSAYATFNLNATTLGLGTFPLVAYYSGDAEDILSDSSAMPVFVTIVGVPTAAALTLSATQIPVLGSATFTVTVTSTASPPTGTISFLNNGNAVGSATLNGSGSASFTMNFAVVGKNVISATFTPTGLFAGSSAASRTLLVTPPLTTAFSPASVSAAAGASAGATLILTPLSGFSGAIQTACLTSVSYVTCTTSGPASISGVVNMPVQVSVAKTSAAFSLPGKSAGVITLALLLPLLSFRRVRRRAAPCLVLVLALCAGGCAEGGDFGFVPAGPQTVAVTVTAAGIANTSYLNVNVLQ